MSRRVIRGQLTFEDGPAEKARRDKQTKRVREYWAKRPGERKAYNRAEYLKDPEKVRERSRAWYHANKDRARESARRRALEKIGTSPEQRDQVLKEQDGRCAICREPFRSTRETHTDHDHKTGLFRGLLCTGCNLALGILERWEFQWIEKAIAYLSNNRSGESVAWRAMRIPRCIKCGTLGHNAQTCTKP